MDHESESLERGISGYRWHEGKNGKTRVFSSGSREGVKQNWSQDMGINNTENV